jgi:hypothetical protein
MARAAIATLRNHLAVAERVVEATRGLVSILDPPCDCCGPWDITSDLDATRSALQEYDAAKP